MSTSFKNLETDVIHANIFVIKSCLHHSGCVIQMKMSLKQCCGQDVLSTAAS